MVKKAVVEKGLKIAEVVGRIAPSSIFVNIKLSRVDYFMTEKIPILICLLSH